MLAGYAAAVALTSVGFNIWLGGQNLFRGGSLVLAKGTLVAVVAGLVAGYVAAAIGRAAPRIHAALVLVPLVVDTAYVLFAYEGPAKNPFWYDVMGSSTLMAATLAGGWLRWLQQRARRTVAA